MCDRKSLTLRPMKVTYIIVGVPAMLAFTLGIYTAVLHPKAGLWLPAILGDLMIVVLFCVLATTRIELSDDCVVYSTSPLRTTKISVKNILRARLKAGQKFL